MKDKNPEEKPRKKLVVEEVGKTPQLEKEAPVVHKEDSKPAIPPDLAPPPVPPRPKFNLLWIIIPGLLILAALVGGIFVYEQGVSRERAKLAQTTPEPTSEAISSPTPTPEAQKIDLSKYTIAIQNGSGIPGEATRAQNLLTKAGFKVVSIGNAGTYDYTKTIIEAKSAVPESYLSQLSNTLGKSYTLGDNQTLSDKEKTDVIIIVGKTKAQ